MVDSSKIGLAFRTWAGAGESLNAAEFKGALNKADKNNDSKLSRSEFDSVASELGLTKSEADSFYDKAKGEGSEVAISDLVSAADDFSTKDGKWTKSDFTDLVNDYTKPAASTFSELAGTDGVLDRDEMQAIVDEANTGCDDCISQEEFSAIAEKLGVEDGDSDAVASAFKDITGDNSSASADEVMSYFAAFADKDGAYTEDAFNKLVENISGAEPAAECASAEETDATEEASESAATGESGETAESEADATKAADDRKADFDFIAGTDGQIQRDEFEDVLSKVDAGQDDKLSIEEFRSFATRIGVDPKNDANIDAVFNAIANGESSITTGQALAYLGGMNGKDNQWGTAAFDKVIERLSNGPDGAGEAASTEAASTEADATEETTGSASSEADAAVAEDCETEETEPSAEFAALAGADNEIERGDWKADLKEADLDGDKKLSKAEFLSFAYELGVPTSSRSNILDVYDIIADGKSGGISFNDAMNYLKEFRGDDKVWDEGEFNDIVADLTDSTESVFSSLATDGKISSATLKEQFETADADGNDQLNAKEFETLAANLGVTDLDSAKLAKIAGSGLNMNLAELTGYANPFGSSANSTVSWDESQFDALVADLSAKNS
jgi:Ca2+-binding EF-hand superfamily protein